MRAIFIIFLNLFIQVINVTLFGKYVNLIVLYFFFYRYGHKGSGTDVPPYATVIYDIELVQVEQILIT